MPKRHKERPDGSRSLNENPTVGPTPVELLGLRIRQRRWALGFTREELGERCGLTPNYIGSIELAHRDPSLRSIERLADGLGTTVGALLGGEEEPLTPEGLEAGRMFDRAPEALRVAVLRLLHALVARRR